MRRFFSAAMAQQERMAEQADRAGREAAATDDNDLVPTLSTADKARLMASFAKGTQHTGTITGRRASGWVVSFGTISGILPFNKTGGASLKIKDRTKVKMVDGFDGSRPPLLTR